MLFSHRFPLSLPRSFRCCNCISRRLRRDGIQTLVHRDRFIRIYSELPFFLSLGISCLSLYRYTRFYALFFLRTLLFSCLIIRQFPAKQVFSNYTVEYSGVKEFCYKQELYVIAEEFSFYKKITFFFLSLLYKNIR